MSAFKNIILSIVIPPVGVNNFTNCQLSTIGGERQLNKSYQTLMHNGFNLSSAGYNSCLRRIAITKNGATPIWIGIAKTAKGIYTFILEYICLFLLTNIYIKGM